MNIKHLEDYTDELAKFFPQVDKKEIKRIINSLSKNLTKYMKFGDRGFHVGSSNSLVEDGKRYRFEVSRIFGKPHLKKIKNRIKFRNRLKNGK